MRKLALVLLILLLPVLQGSAKPSIIIKDVVITPKYKPNGTILVDIQVTVWLKGGREGWVEVHKDGSIFEIAKKYFNATQVGEEGEKTITLENINIGFGKTTIKVEAVVCSCSVSTNPYPYCSIVANCTWKDYTKDIDANTLIVPTTTIIEKTATLKTTETVTKFVNYTVTQVVTETEINTVTNTVTETKTITQVIKEEVTPIWAYASLGSFIIIAALLVLLILRKNVTTPP